MIINPYAFTTGGGGGGDPDFQVTTFGDDGEIVPFAERFGWIFTVGASDIVVTKLRVNMLDTGVAELVRIHRNSDNTLMASASITPASANVWAEGVVPSVTLLAGVSYTISTRAGGAFRNVRRNNTHVISSAVTKTGNVFGSDDNRPTSSSGNVYVFSDFGS